MRTKTICSIGLPKKANEASFFKRCSMLSKNTRSKKTIVSTAKGCTAIKKFFELTGLKKA
jgi:hypothetical protein